MSTTAGAERAADTVPNHDADLEGGTLAAFCDPIEPLANELWALFDPTLFYSHNHAVLARELRRLRESGASIDMPRVLMGLKATPNEPPDGGWAAWLEYLLCWKSTEETPRLISRACLPANLPDALIELRRLAELRRLRLAIAEAGHELNNGHACTTDILAAVRKPLAEVLAEGEPAGEMELVSFETLAARADDERDDALLEGVLFPGEISILGGHTGAGKSWLALHLGRALATGRDFLGRKVKASDFVFVSGEMSERYAKSFVRGIVGDDAEPVSRNCILLNPPNPFTMEHVRALCRGPEGLLVLDSNRSLFPLPGDDENKSGPVGEIMRPLREIARKTGWHICPIHHLTKNAPPDALGLAGSGAFGQHADAVLTWSREAESAEGILRFPKLRAEPIPALKVRLTLTGCELLGTAADVQRKTEVGRILDMLPAEGPGLRAADLVEMEGAPRRRILDETLPALHKQGKVKRAGAGTKKDPYRYVLKVFDEG